MTANSASAWALDEYFDLGIELFEADAATMRRAWQRRQNLSFYDALYFDLAEQNNLELLTADARIERTRAARCPVTTIRND